MARMVLLLHELPDGSSHYDWMIQKPSVPVVGAVRGTGAEPGPEERCLITFRVTERIDLPQVQGFLAERLADHRYAYLDYEGPISGNRGSVRRMAEGFVQSVEELAKEGTISVRCSFAGGGEGVWNGVLLGDRWRFAALRSPSAGAVEWAG